MSGPDTPPTGPSAWDGARTAADGTPVAVDVSKDRPARVTWAVLLAGPVTWLSHFMLVYLVAEAGCTGDGPGLRLFNPPVPAAVAALACLAFARWGYRRWRASHTAELSSGVENSDRDGSLAFAGFLLSSFFFVAILFVGLPALVMEC
jgi:hypothetical protein